MPNTRSNEYAAYTVHEYLCAVSLHPGWLFARPKGVNNRMFNPGNIRAGSSMAQRFVSTFAGLTQSTFEVPRQTKGSLGLLTLTISLMFYAGSRFLVPNNRCWTSCQQDWRWKNSGPTDLGREIGSGRQGRSAEYHVVYLDFERICRLPLLFFHAIQRLQVLLRLLSSNHSQVPFPLSFLFPLLLPLCIAMPMP